MRSRAARRARLGFTLIEALIVAALMALVFVKLTMVVGEAQRAHGRESMAMALDDQASRVLDRVSFAIIGSRADTVNPGVEAPFSTADLEYQISLGVEDGEVVLGDPEVIGLNEDAGQLYWGQNVDTVDERVVVWCNTVSEMLEDELLNGFDDNENGLADELGLSFVMSGRTVTIRISLERTYGNGQVYAVTKETSVTCRN